MGTPGRERNPKRNRARGEPQQAAAKPEVKAEPVEKIKNTSLFIFGTALEAELATSLGYHALAAVELKPPLDPAFTRAALFNNGKDEGLSRDLFSYPRNRRSLCTHAARLESHECFRR